MKQPPSNRNVPKHIWDRACLEYDAYADKHKTLMGLGLSDAEADQYIDAYDTLESMLELLDPSEPDFRHDDHRDQIAEADAAIKLMATLLR